MKWCRSSPDFRIGQILVTTHQQIYQFNFWLSKNKRLILVQLSINITFINYLVIMDKKTIFSLFIIIFLSTVLVFNVKAQNIRLLEYFDDIPLGDQRYKVEGFMKNFAEFSQTDINNTWCGGDTKYLGIKYKSSREEEIMLLFYNGVLYLKQLVFNYSLSEQEVAKDEYKNLKKYILSTNIVIETNELEITNNVYGSQIGETTAYIMTESTKLYKTKEASFSGKLDFNYDLITKSSANLIGYEVIYVATDLSNTELDAKDGIYYSY
ncbi:MAG: hypothetical protein K8R68_00640 [Bacteroidales bacterium]|nr:hypothetical protein [Bacteroidales bacterium]